MMYIINPSHPAKGAIRKGIEQMPAVDYYLKLTIICRIVLKGLRAFVASDPSNVAVALRQRDGGVDQLALLYQFRLQGLYAQKLSHDTCVHKQEFVTSMHACAQHTSTVLF